MIARFPRDFSFCGLANPAARLKVCCRLLKRGLNNMRATRPATSLADLAKFGLARVVRVHGDDSASQRLSELGFTPGTEVDFVRKAPFGGPLVVQLRGYQLALRPGEAKRVEIETTGGRA